MSISIVSLPSLEAFKGSPNKALCLMKHTGFPHWAVAGLSSFQSYYPLSLKTVDPNVLKEYSYHSLDPAGLLPDPLDFRGLTAFLNRKSPGEIRISTVLGHRGKSRNREIRLSSFPNS